MTMGLRLKMTSGLEWLTTVRHPDPTQARRGRLLSVLLLGTGVATILGMLAFVALGMLNGWSTTTMAGVLSGVIMLPAGLGLYLLNRSVSPRTAAIIFLVVLLLLLSFADEPQQIISGRTTLMYVLPIVMASVALSPASSFVFAGLVSVLLLGMSAYFAVAQPVSPISLLAFFLVALVGWLAARSLENALADLRTINRELDQRVADRTRDLAEALARERAEASKNQAILEGIADGVIVFDNDGRAIVANPAISRLLEQPAGQIAGSTLERLMDGNVSAADRGMILELLGAKDKGHASFRFQWSAKTLSVSMAPVRGALGEVIGTVAVFRDFTREAEVERMKSAFVSMVSHELRTPLNAILGYAEMLIEAVYGSLLEKQRNVVVRVMTNTKRLLSLVNDLLDQAQIEAGKLTLQATAFSPAELIDGLFGVMSEIARGKGLRLTSDIAPDIPTALAGDPQRLHQILVNLVNNAIKFTPHGTVGVRIYRHDPAHWALAVADTGVGIASDAQSRIFEPFWQVEDTATRSHAGVGLGLSIVKQLTTLMGGEITLTSEVGRGSTFTIVLPLVPLQETAP